MIINSRWPVTGLYMRGHGGVRHDSTTVMWTFTTTVTYTAYTSLSQVRSNIKGDLVSNFQISIAGLMPGLVEQATDNEIGGPFAPEFDISAIRWCALSWHN